MSEKVGMRQLIEEIAALLARTTPPAPDEVAALLEGVHPADIAEVLAELEEEEALAVFNALPLEVASEVLDETSSEVTGFLFEQLPDARLAALLSQMPMDDAARLLAGQERARAETLMRQMAPRAAADVRELLGYPEGSAGRIMNDRVARLRGAWSVAQAFEYLRRVDSESEMLTHLYTVDGEGCLTGVLPLRQLVMAQPEQTIAEIRTTDVISVGVLDRREEVAEVAAKYDFFAVPVVDEAGRLAGVVTVDDIVDVLEAEATEDIQRLGGSTPLNNPYFAVSVPSMARKRVGWLLLLFLGGTLTANVIAYFEDALAQAVVLMLFVPLLVGTAGNSGSQTVSTIIRALALGEVTGRDSLRVLVREFATGLTVGSMLGLIAFFFVYYFGSAGFAVALVVALTMPLICTWSTLVASLIPIVADKFGVDPTVISAPLITTLVDATGLIIYFMIARAVLGI
jgi:magnesium transporter